MLHLRALPLRLSTLRQAYALSPGAHSNNEHSEVARTNFARATCSLQALSTRSALGSEHGVGNLADGVAATKCESNRDKRPTALDILGLRRGQFLHFRSPLGEQQERCSMFRHRYSLPNAAAQALAAFAKLKATPLPWRAVEIDPRN